MMKKYLLIVTLFCFCIVDLYGQNNSETKIQLNIDGNTNCQLRYYYYPTLQAYFDLLKNVYYYQENGTWKTAESLPKFYGGYSLYKMNHVIITDYDDEEPFKHIIIHKKLYPFKNTKKKILN